MCWYCLLLLAGECSGGELLPASKVAIVWWTRVSQWESFGRACWSPTFAGIGSWSLCQCLSAYFVGSPYPWIYLYFHVVMFWWFILYMEVGFGKGNCCNDSYSMFSCKWIFEGLWFCRKEIGSKLKLLVILSLAGCPRVTMANLLYLCGCVSLEVCFASAH